MSAGETLREKGRREGRAMWEAIDRDMAAQQRRALRKGLLALAIALPFVLAGSAALLYAVVRIVRSAWAQP